MGVIALITKKIRVINIRLITKESFSFAKALTKNIGDIDVVA